MTEAKAEYYIELRRSEGAKWAKVFNFAVDIDTVSSNTSDLAQAIKYLNRLREDSQRYHQICSSYKYRIVKITITVEVLDE